MTELEQIEKQKKILTKIIEKHSSSRAFARSIGEDSSDIFRWTTAGKLIGIRAAVKICKEYGVLINDLRPDIFDETAVLTFRKDKK